MKRVKEISICLGVGLVLSAQAGTGGAAVADNPYPSITTRNVFGLTPTTETVAVPAVPDKLPPKITINGITSIFGRLQVLFKVSGTEPGQPAKENSYMLDENQSRDDINVMHIDAEAEMVTFNNHGLVQEIPLANTPVPTAPKLAVSKPAAMPEETVPKSYPPEFVRARTPDYLGGGQITTNKVEPLTKTSLEERIILIEAQRAVLKSQNDPAADELPPTALTPTDTGAAKGI